MYAYDERGDGKRRGLLQRIYLCGKIMAIQPPVQICRAPNVELGPPMWESEEVKKIRKKKN